MKGMCLVEKRKQTTHKKKNKKKKEKGSASGLNLLAYRLVLSAKHTKDKNHT